ncbi:MAG: CDGSH iron-sulfur domain-containing protein [Sulfurovum sp.]|nr:CDGSH iron-sulfur domain-containing protein [Sulfurovum sp.]
MVFFRPVYTQLKSGKNYQFCNCGKSVDGVLCDGSHKGTSITPTEFTVKNTDGYYLCKCKKCYNGIFCDSNHTKKEKLSLDFEV